MLTMSNIPAVQTAVIFDEHGGELKVVHDHPVVQPADLKPGQALVQIKVSIGGCRCDRSELIVYIAEASSTLEVGFHRLQPT